MVLLGRSWASALVQISACPVARLMRSMVTKLDEGAGGGVLLSYDVTLLYDLLGKVANLPGKFYELLRM